MGNVSVTEAKRCAHALAVISEVAYSIAMFHDAHKQKRKRTVHVESAEFSHVLLKAESELNAAHEELRLWCVESYGEPTTMHDFDTTTKNALETLAQVQMEIFKLRHRARC